MLETWNLVRKSTYIYSFNKYTFSYQDLVNQDFLKVTFFGKSSAFTQSISMRAVLEIFQFCFQFLQDKFLLLMNI